MEHGRPDPDDDSQVLLENQNSSVIISNGSTSAEAAADLEQDGDDQQKSRSRFTFLSWILSLGADCGAPFLTVVMIVYGLNQGYGDAMKNMVTNYYWKDVQKQQPAAAQGFQALAGLPWDIKPIYGLITDTFPIAGYKKWPYLAICGTAGTLCFWALSLLPTPSPLIATAIFAASAICSAFPDVVTDAAVAQRSRDLPHIASDLQSLSWGSMAIGGLAGCAISGPSVHSLGPKASFMLISIAPLMLIVAACSLPEKRLPKHLSGANTKALLNTMHLFVKTLQSSSIWRPALYIYLLSGAVCPDISEAMFFWLTDTNAGPGFSESFISLVNAFGYVAMVCGILIYNCWFRFHSFRGMFLWTQIAVCFIGLSDVILVTRYNRKIGIPDHAFVLGDQTLSKMISRLQLMPMMVLCAKLCPPGIEGTIFAFLMSVSNLGGTCAAWLGAYLLKWLRISKSNYGNLWLAVLVRSLMRLLPLLFLWLVPHGTSETLVLPLIPEIEEQQLEIKEVESKDIAKIKLVNDLEMAQQNIS